MKRGGEEKDKRRRGEEEFIGERAQISAAGAMLLQATYAPSTIIIVGGGRFERQAIIGPWQDGIYVK